MLVFLIILMLVFTACDTCQTPVSSGNSGDGYDLFYSAFPMNASNLSIYRSNENGDEIRQVIENAAFYSSPSVNNKIAFLRKDESSLNNLYLYDISAGKLTAIDKENSLFDIVYPMISSDGNYISFLGGSGKLFIYNVKLGILELISMSILPNSIPSFSPDAKKIAYFSNESDIRLCVNYVDEYDYRIMDYVLSDVRTDNRYTTQPNWSYDSDRIIYSVFDDDNCYINITKLNGENSFIELDKNDLSAYSPVLNFDDKYIAFYSADGNIWVAGNNDENLFYKLTDNSNIRFNSSPKWSPDNNSLVYNSILKGDGNIGKLILLKLNNNKFDINEKIIVSDYSFNAYWR